MALRGPKWVHDDQPVCLRVCCLLLLVCQRVASVRYSFLGMT